MTDLQDTLENRLALIAEGIINHSQHDDEFDKHLGMSKQSTMYGQAKKEFVHMYMKATTTKKKKKGEPEPSISTNLNGIMKYHGYEKIKTNSKTRRSWSKDDKHKYHEVHADTDADGEPKVIYHRERFK